MSDSEYDSWFKKREDVEEALHEGWRQHFCQTWGFVGQQYLADCRYDTLSKTVCNEEAVGRGSLESLRKWFRRLKGPWFNKA